MKKKFTNARIYRRHDEISEILVEDGTIREIGTDLPAADEDIDLQGRLVVPPYVDPHLHLDYVYTARSEGATNTTGTLFEGIARWHEVKKTRPTKRPGSVPCGASSRRSLGASSSSAPTSTSTTRS